jgi:protein-S-isoprenylcysteine O-methyltransferase Ste14
MAIDKIKNFFVPTYLKQTDYRKIYNLKSLILILIILNNKKGHENIYLDLPEFTRYIGYLLFILGSVLGIVSFKTFGLKPFLGISREFKTQKLKTNGIYHYVRHPLYSSLLLIYLALVLIFQTDLWLVTALCGIVYLPIGIYLEEKKLKREFSEYGDYKKRVKSIIPYIL